MSKSTFKMIPCVEAADMPPEVIDWCEMHDISTHYNNSVAMCWNDENVFTKWAESIGIKPDYYKIGDKKRKKWTVAIIAT